MDFLTCYVEKRGENWEGVCIDFDIAVQGHSFEEIQGKLGRAIREYVEHVKELPEAEQGRFWNRRVPLHVRFAFAVRVFLTYLFATKHRGDDGFRGTYTLPCAA